MTEDEMKALLEKYGLVVIKTRNKILNVGKTPELVLAQAISSVIVDAVSEALNTK